MEKRLIDKLEKDCKRQLGLGEHKPAHLKKPLRIKTTKTPDRGGDAA